MFYNFKGLKKENYYIYNYEDYYIIGKCIENDSYMSYGGIKCYLTYEGYEYYHNNCSFSASESQELLTDETLIHWLDECNKLNKFISKKEALKTFNKTIKEDENSMKKIKEILEGIYKDEVLRKNCIPLFIGNPGLGKSMIIHDFAKEKGVNVVEMIGSTLMPHEISGIAIPVQETGLMTYFDFDRLLQMKDGDILFLDELLNTNPMVLNAFLTLLTTRKMISGKSLPNIMIVAAANKQGASILTPQIKERFIFYNVNFDPNMWAQYMYKKYLIIDEVLTDLITLIQNETFLTSDTNYMTPRSIDKAIDMIIKGVNTPYSTKLLPILNKIVENTTGEQISYGNGKIWDINEKISWLKLKTKINDKINSES